MEVKEELLKLDDQRKLMDEKIKELNIRLEYYHNKSILILKNRLRQESQGQRRISKRRFRFWRVDRVQKSQKGV